MGRTDQAAELGAAWAKALDRGGQKAAAPQSGYAPIAAMAADVEIGPPSLRLMMLKFTISIEMDNAAAQV
jgi:hypothetical protein